MGYTLDTFNYNAFQTRCDFLNALVKHWKFQLAQGECSIPSLFWLRSRGSLTIVPSEGSGFKSQCPQPSCRHPWARLTVNGCIYFTRSYTHRQRCQPRKATASSSGALTVRCLAQGQLDIQLGGAGDRTSNLPVTSRPALPPEPHAAHLKVLVFHPNVCSQAVVILA